jgi:hypothetical protein
MQKHGIVYTTALISGVCIIISVLITAIAWELMEQPNFDFAVIVAIICPLVIAPPVIYFYTRLSLKLEDRRHQLELVNKKLQLAFSEVKVLSGLLPICTSCKKIRDDKGYWNQIESFIRDRSEVEFSHGVCPDCAKKLYPDMDFYGE